MKYVLIILGAAVMIAFGYYAAKRFDDFLAENRENDAGEDDGQRS